MVNRPKQIGTAAETAVVRAARTRGFPGADRLTLTGRFDRGDIGLCPGVILEIKGGNTAKTASDLQIATWLAETELERTHAHADIALLVIQRAGHGPTNAHHWWAWWRLGWLEGLRSPEPHCRVCGCTNSEACPEGCAWRSDDGDGPCCTSCDPNNLTATSIPIRMLLTDALQILRAAGYGNPFDNDAARAVPALSRAGEVSR